jgi:hypothetical protein
MDVDFCQPFSVLSIAMVLIVRMMPLHAFVEICLRLVVPH